MKTDGLHHLCPAISAILKYIPNFCKGTHLVEKRNFGVDQDCLPRSVQNGLQHDLRFTDLLLRNN